MLSSQTIKVYLRVFVNEEQNDWARLLSIAKFAYNNAKNISTGHRLLEINCNYHLRISYKEDIDPRSRSKSANKLSIEFRELMSLCRKNLHYAQELQKRAHDKAVKPRSYALSDKVWLNSKYNQTKQNWKLEAEFFWSFWVLHLIENQDYKLKLLKKWKIYDVFHGLLLENDTTRKGQIDATNTQLEFEVGDNGKKYDVEVI